MLFDKTKCEVAPRTVVLVGGEPFLRQDIIAVLETARTTFAHFGVSTNGTCFDKLKEQEFSALRRISLQSGERTLQVSLDSFSPECNDVTRGLTEEAIRGIDALERHRVPFMLGIVLTTANIHTLVQTVTHALRTFQYMTSIYIGELIPSKTLGGGYSDLKVDIQSQRARIAEITNMRRMTNRPDVQLCSALDGSLEYYLPDGTLGERPVLEAFNQHGDCSINAMKTMLPACRAGVTRAGVLANGDVSQCLFLRDGAVGNLYLESWPVIWARSVDRYRAVSRLGMGDGRQCWHHNVAQAHSAVTRGVAQTACPS